MKLIQNSFRTLPGCDRWMQCDRFVVTGWVNSLELRNILLPNRLKYPIVFIKLLFVLTDEAMLKFRANFFKYFFDV